MKLSFEQETALDKMINFLNNDELILVLEGYAGTGKTSILNKYVTYLHKNTTINFVLCSPTHKAKLVLEEITGFGAVTLHKLLSLSPNIEIFNLDFKDLKFLSLGTSEMPQKGLVIVDEASMITDDLYEMLENYAKSKDSKLLFIGDPAQLQGVNNQGKSLAFSCKNKITLTTIHRQSEDNGLIPILSDLRSKHKSMFSPIISNSGSLYVYNNAKSFMLTAADSFNIAINKQDVNHCKLVAYTNNRVKGLNACMRKLLWNDSAEYHRNEFITGYENFEYNHNQFYNSLDYVIINDPKLVYKRIPNYMKLPGYELELYDKVYKQLLNVFILSKDISSDYINSLADLIEDIRMSAIELKNRGNRTKSNTLWRKYFEITKSFASPYDIMFDNRVIKKKTFDYGYASTTHKCQGTTFNEIFIDMNNLYQCRNAEELRQLQYVALSRTKTNAHLLL